jgi:hypothetical protein
MVGSAGAPAGAGEAAPHAAGRWLREAPGGLRPSAPLAARWARIVAMTLGWMMKAMIRIVPQQRGQTRGFTS